VYSFNKLSHRISEKKGGASFYRSDIHIPVSTIPRQQEEMVTFFREAELDIVGLISYNLEELIFALELVETLNIQGINIFPLVGFWLEIPWPDENMGILGLYEAAHSDYKIKKLLEHTRYDEKKRQATKDISIHNIVKLIHSDDGLAFYSPPRATDISEISKNKRLFLSLKEDGYDGIETSHNSSQFSATDFNNASHLPPLPVFISSRAQNTSDVGKQYTLLKAPHPSYDGIKGSMKDPASRIRYPGELSSGFHRIVGMEIEGKFFQKEVFHFNPNLNCILGGKGTGKTALIELLRFAFNLSSPEEIKKYYLRNESEFLSFLLDNGTIRVWVENKDGRSFIITRSLDDEESRIFTQGGEEITANVTSGETFSLDILGWSEIEYRAQSSGELLKMLDLSREETKNIKHEISEVKQDLYTLGEKLVTIRRQGAQNLKRLKELLAKKEELEALKKSEYSQLVKNYEVRYKREFLLDKYIQKLIQFEETFKRYFEQDAFLAFEKQFHRLNSPNVPEINQLLKEITHRFQKNIQYIEKNMDVFLEKLDDSNSYLMQQKSRLQKLHEKEKKMTLQKKKQHGKKIREVMQKLSTLALAVNSIPETKHKQLLIQEEYQELRQDISNNVSRLKKLLNKQQELRKDIQVLINQELGPDIQMEFIPFYETSSIDDYFTGIVDNCEDEKTSNILRQSYQKLKDKTVNLLDFNWINDGKELSKLLDLSSQETKRVRTFLLKNYDSLLQLTRYDISPLPKLLFRNKPVYQLSSGQRCTTVLPVLFLLGNHPLIIDQPEDNLDNAYIFHQIVQPIRKQLKGHRQLILVTHNPNIPVSGDAEKVFLMEADDTHGWVKAGGYIDEEEMPVEIQSILEGGKEAFGLRQQKYGY